MAPTTAPSRQAPGTSLPFFRVVTSPALIALLLAFALVAALGACGGDDGEAGPPPATQPPAPTAPPAAPTETSLPNSGSEDLFIQASSFKEVEVELNAGDVLRVDYESQFRIVGRSESGGNVGGIKSGVEFVITDPLREIAHQSEQLSTNQVTYTAETTGTHVLGFINPFNLQGQSVAVNYVINP